MAQNGIHRHHGFTHFVGGKSALTSAINRCHTVNFVRRCISGSARCAKKNTLSIHLYCYHLCIHPVHCDTKKKTGFQDGLERESLLLPSILPILPGFQDFTGVYICSSFKFGAE